MTDTRPIEEACYWLARQPREAEPPLAGRHEADFAIVGAGLTGLWTALHLKRLEPSAAIAVVEQRTAAYGGSGRNAGMLSETIDHSHGLAIRHFGREEAARLAVLGRDNLTEMLATLATHGIDCALERTGVLQVALSAAHVAELRAEHAHAHALGMTHYRLLDREATRAEIRCERYLGALFNPNAALLDPVALVRGLKRVAQRQGTAVFEGTRVTGLAAAGAGVRLRTEAGELRARRAILATSAYTLRLVPRLRFRYLPLYDYVLASEPLSPAQRAAIGWPGRQGVTDARAFFKYYRLTADDRVVWGTSEAAYYPGNRLDPACDHSPGHYAALRASFVRHFPALAGLAFPYAWGGPIDATTRFTPFFGATLGGRVLYGLGFTGHGLGTTHLAGRILAHAALARASGLEGFAFVRRRPFPYPPEPLRTWAVLAVTRQLRRVDAGGRPGRLLRALDALGLGLSS